MARPRSSMPKYRYHVSGQAVVTLAYRDYYLGPHDSPESRARYFELIAIYNEHGQSMPPDIPERQIDEPITVRAVTGEYRQHIEEKYDHDRSEYNRYKRLCDTLDDEYGDIPAEDFGPRKLAAIRELLIVAKNSRGYINKQMRGIRAIFRYAVACELIGIDVVQRLEALEPLRKRQTKAKEGRFVAPVDLAVVKATAKHLSPILKAMVELQAATGMRPSEVCKLRPCDIEQRDDGVWLYRPGSHKTERHGKDRVIPIVGDLRITLGRFLDRDPEAFCFSPRDAMAWRREQQRKNRKSKVQPSQRDRSKSNAKRLPGECYKSTSYYRAIERAAKRADVPHWFPYQLRHTRATLVREALGIEAAQALLGHSRVDMTEVYTQRSIEKAIEAAKSSA